jgi:hypothetical protein
MTRLSYKIECGNLKAYALEVLKVYSKLSNEYPSELDRAELNAAWICLETNAKIVERKNDKHMNLSGSSLNAPPSDDATI